MALTACARLLLSPAGRLRFRQRWSARLLQILGVRLVADAVEIPPGSLLVANHVSWLDVFVINATYPAAFVSKAEVRDWPLAGWLARHHDTVFLRRGSHGHARIVNGEIAALLGHQRHVAVFPEGTTTDGSHVLSFHGALLQAAIGAGAAIQPLAIAYRLPDGGYTRAPAYDGDVSLLASLQAVIAETEIVARLRVPARLDTLTTPNRKLLARDAHAAVVAGISG